MGYRTFVKEQIALGKMPYAEKVQLMGRNGGNTTSATTLWTVASGTYAQLTAGTTFELVSSSANDAAAGTGARTVQVDYVDGNYEGGSEVVTMNGTTPVPMVATNILAINKLTVLTAGSGLVNAGAVSARTVSGSVIKNQIGANALSRGQSFSMLYTVPKGKLALLGDIHFSNTGSTGDVTLYALSFDSAGVEKVLGTAGCALSNTGFSEGKGVLHFGTGLVIPEKTLIEVRSLVSAATSSIMASAELLVFDVANNGLF